MNAADITSNEVHRHPFFLETSRPLSLRARPDVCGRASRGFMRELDRLIGSAVVQNSCCQASNGVYSKTPARLKYDRASAENRDRVQALQLADERARNWNRVSSKRILIAISPATQCRIEKCMEIARSEAKRQAAKGLPQGIDGYDLLAEAYYSLTCNLYEQPDTSGGRLRRSIRHDLLDYLRKQRRDRARVSLADNPDDYTFAPARDSLRVPLELLKDAERKVIYFVYERDYSTSEAARAMGNISQPHVSRLLRSAIATLADAMGARVRELEEQAVA